MSRWIDVSLYVMVILGFGFAVIITWPVWVVCYIIITALVQGLS